MPMRRLMRWLRIGVIGVRGFKQINKKLYKIDPTFIK